MTTTVAGDSFLNQLTSNGYQKMPGGLIMQWGGDSIAEDHGGGRRTKVFNFPMQFP